MKRRTLLSMAAAGALASLTPDVLKVVQQSPLGGTLGRERMFFNVQAAAQRYAQNAGTAAGSGLTTP